MVSVLVQRVQDVFVARRAGAGESQRPRRRVTRTWRSGSGSTTRPSLSHSHLERASIVGHHRRRRLSVVVVVVDYCCLLSFPRSARSRESRVVDVHGHLPLCSKWRGHLATAGDHGVTVRVEPVHNRTPRKKGAVWALCPNLETLQLWTAKHGKF